MPLWNKIDLDVEPRPFHLCAGDNCFYARDYISEGGYKASDANQFISNFKKDPSKRGTGQWFYKQRDAKRFASELEGILPKACHIAVIPTSKPDGHPEYDPRFDMMLDELRGRRPDLIICKPIYRAEPCQSLHTGGRRSVAQALLTLRWRGFEGEEPKAIILIDDVITCGTNFKACQQLLRQHCPEIVVIGVFWARTVRLDNDEPDWAQDDD